MDSYTNERNKAREALTAMARREAAGELGKADRSTQKALLRDAEMLLDEYNEIVELCRGYKANLARAKEKSARLKALSDARAAVASHEAETRRILEQRKRDLDRVLDAVNVAAKEFAAVALAEGDTVVTAYKHAAVLGVEQPDIDGYTFACEQHGVSLGDGPTLKISDSEFWVELQHSRHARMRKVLTAAAEEHQSAVNAWTRRAKRDEPQPVFTAPKWSDVAGVR